MDVTVGPVVELDAELIYQLGRMRDLPQTPKHLALVAYMAWANTDIDSKPVLLPLGQAIQIRSALEPLTFQARKVRAFITAITVAVENAGDALTVPTWLWPGDAAVKVHTDYRGREDEPIRVVIASADFATGTVTTGGEFPSTFREEDGRWLNHPGSDTAVEELFGYSSPTGYRWQALNMARRLQDIANTLIANQNVATQQAAAEAVRAWTYELDQLTFLTTRKAAH